MTQPVMGNPTVGAMKQVFPTFNTLSDTLVQFALDEAAISIGNWSHKAKNIAWMYLAAHILAVGQSSDEANGRDIRHEAIGRISVSYKSDLNINSQSWGDLSTTTYGRRYLRLRQNATSVFHMLGGRLHRHNTSTWGWLDFWF